MVCAINFRHLLKINLALYNFKHGIMKITKLLLLVIGTLTINSSFAKQKSTQSVVENSLKFSTEQAMILYESVSKLPDRLPRTMNSNGTLATSTAKHWVSGFFPGTLWYLYHYSNDEQLKIAARTMTQRVEKQQYTTDNHDVGFMINCSFGNGYKYAILPTDKTVLINAARSLSTRFNPLVGCTKSWNNKKWEFPVIIDNMMNLELLCKATRLSGDSTYYKMALSHADTTLKYHYRPDGSAYHVLSYDTIHGGVISKVNHQGAFDESAWARGQAWGLYGFTMMYRETGKIAYLNQAIKIANFIINHPNLPEDKIPYWDFNAPKIPNELRDASAGAIMASAFIELATFAPKELSKKYLSIAEQQIHSLSSDKYLAKKGENAGFILKHSVGYFLKGSEVDVPLTYADYYFVEALIRYRNLGKKLK